MERSSGMLERGEFQKDGNILVSVFFALSYDRYPLDKPFYVIETVDRREQKR